MGDTRVDVNWQSSDQLSREDNCVAHVALQIAGYFRGALQVFNLPIAPTGNPFLQNAWSHLMKARYGTTITYADLAQRLDKPTSARAIVVGWRALKRA
ncbi:methylated-DNA--[protein]-cysteine S-methyltransferase [Brucella pseudogrignonensis]|uniref:methylated-DNA--[protein]-cysteine S-methyltransferase n=1 Tax=Brucella pseudogrignonensis TaxID=419475 RepID=UPI003857C8AB